MQYIIKKTLFIHVPTFSGDSLLFLESVPSPQSHSGIVRSGDLGSIVADFCKYRG